MTKRKIAAIKLHDIVPNAPAMAVPVFEWMDPATLIVNGAYQRNLSDRSYRLIRKLISSWDWNRFRPPVVALTPDGFEVIDGQHTSIAAASHPGIVSIPVMVVQAEEMAQRAEAFLGLNKDRLGMTATQIHHAAVASGDEDALTIEQVCARAGVRILRLPPSHGTFKPGDSMAVAGIGKLISRHGVIKARELLQALVAAGIAPGITEIRAAELLLHDEEYVGAFEPGDLTSTVIKVGSKGLQKAKVFAATHNVPIYRALAVVWYRERPRGRRSAA